MIASLEKKLQGQRGLGAAGLADDAGRDTGDGGIRRHVLQHHRTGGDAGAMADPDIAEHLGPGADQDAVTDLRMPVAVFLSGPPQSDGMQHGDVVADHRRFADDDGMGVVDHDPFADSRGRMDVDTEGL